MIVVVNLAGSLRSVDMARNIPVGNCNGCWESLVVMALAFFWSQLTARSSARGRVVDLWNLVVILIFGTSCSWPVGEYFARWCVSSFC